MHERIPDELLLELEVTFHGNGDVELRQGEFEGYDMTVTLHRSQMEWLAREQGYIGPEEVARRQQAARDRLALLVGLVRSHCPVGHPLRVAAGFLVGNEPEDPIPSLAPATTLSTVPHAAMTGPRWRASSGSTAATPPRYCRTTPGGADDKACAAHCPAGTRHG